MENERKDAEPAHPGAASSRGTDPNRGLRILVSAAGIVVVVAGLKAAASFLLPIIVALFLALLCIPPMRRLQTVGVPSGVAIFIVMFVAMTFVILLPAVIGQSVDEFQEQLPTYREKIDDAAARLFAVLDQIGLHIRTDELTSRFDAGALLQLVASTAGGLVAMLSNLFLVMLTMVFILLEASGFERKLRLAMGDPDADLSEFSALSNRVQRYLAIKAYLSLATGACVTAAVWAVGVDFPLLWGLVAFLFNFVPNIGSIIAAVPAVLLAFLQFGAARAVVLGGAYLAINLLIGNALEPRLMGRRLGLSTLVVFLSLLFWGWVWGPVGMLLSVPLTVILKIMLEHTDDFRWLAYLLGPSDDQPRRPWPARSSPQPPK